VSNHEHAHAVPAPDIQIAERLADEVLWHFEFRQPRPAGASGRRGAERIVRYLLGVAAQRFGERDEARSTFEAVVEATEFTDANLNKLALFAIPSWAAFERTDAISGLTYSSDTEVGTVAAGMSQPR